MSSDKTRAGEMTPDPTLRARLRELYDDYFACLEDQDLATRGAEDAGGGEAGEAAADDGDRSDRMAHSHSDR